MLTGSPLPPGTNSVVRIEDARRRGNRIELRSSVRVGRDIARRGEDFRRGDPIAGRGTRLRPWHLAALVANEIPRVPVRRRHRVALVRTGAEVVRRGRSLRRGEVRDTTGPLLRAALEELGVVVIDVGPEPDDERTIRRSVARVLEDADVVVTIGGSSVGRRDLVRRAVEGLPHSRVLARRLRLRPGGSTGVAVVGRRPVFLLSGPPVAAYAGFLAVVEPFLARSGGFPAESKPVVLARLGRAVPHVAHSHELLRVRLTRGRAGMTATPLERGGAARLSSLTGADGLAVLEQGHGDYRRGDAVRVLPL